MKSVLFVDDDLLVLQGLRRMLAGMRSEWDMRFAGSGVEALEMMAAKPADVVVSDMRMPEMNGAQLLNEIVDRYPATARFILSGYSDMQMVMQCIRGTHQFLAKPCDGALLKTAISQALRINAWINNDVVKTLVAHLTTLPSLPSLYFEIVKELDSPEADLGRIGSVIARDPAMTAKILQLVNSAFFGLGHHVADPTEAVTFLGLETIKSLVLAVHVFSEYDNFVGMKEQVERMQAHSIRTACDARAIMMMETRDKRVVAEAFTGGLLHDIGRLVLLANLPQRYARVITYSKQQEIPLRESERLEYGVSHAEIGGYLLGLWGLPASLVEIVLFHNDPGYSQGPAITPLTAVHVANMFENEGCADFAWLSAHLDQEYLARVGASERLLIWWKTLAGKKTTSN